MNAEELIEEIKYMRALQAQHKKLLRKTELQVAGFGAHVPAYLEVEKDDLEAKILACDEKIKTLNNKP